MRRPRPTALAIAVALLVAPACFYDSMSPPGAADDSTTTGETTSPPESTAEAATTADSTTTSTADSSTTADPAESTTTTTTTDADTTTDSGDLPDVCGAATAQFIALVKDAAVESPMVVVMSQTGEGDIASSPVAELGTVDFTVEIPCTANFYVWARVYDNKPGTYQSDPDSFYAHANQNNEVTFYYGCGTEGLEPGWSWQRIRGSRENSCDSATSWTPHLTAGKHHIILRNREGEALNNQAAVARILVTNDPAYVPMKE